MKVIILAGGLGTRISEETYDKPKPMVLIDRFPMIWHLMNIFSIQGFKEFVIATGYKSDVVENWVNEQSKRNSLNGWDVTTLNTGVSTQTGGRIARCMKLSENDSIMATYGDGLANINLGALIDFHRSHGKFATVTAVRPPARFGVLRLDNSLVTNFGEKDQSDSGWINGGFFVLEPEVFNYIESDDEPFEIGALPRLVSENQLMAYCHSGFWKPMDTLREKIELQKYAQQNIPPWLSGLI